MGKKLRAVIIKGNPKYINTSLARGYYSKIESFLKTHGVHDVTMDAGDYETRPRLDADLYIAHSRGCGRKKYMPVDKQKVFLSFGTAGGVNDPVDLKWIKEVYVKGTHQQPPKEHFVFIQAQQDAILDLLEKINKKNKKENTAASWK